MMLRAKILGRAGLHGNRPPDMAATNSRTTRCLSAAPHLRQAMQPGHFTDAGTTEPRPALPVGRIYALRTLFGVGGAIPAYSVDMRRVRRHCLLALVQTAVRDLVALATVAACFRVDHWGIGLGLGIVTGAAILLGRSRLFLPLTIAAIAGTVAVAARGGPSARTALTVPLICLGVCFGLYLLDVLAGIAHVRRIFRRPIQAQPPAPAAKPPLELRTPTESEFRRWQDGNGHNGNGNGPNGNGNGSHESDHDVSGHVPALPPAKEPERVYFGRNGIIGSGEPIRALPLTVKLEKRLDPEREIGAFTSSELMEAISRQLRSQSAGDGQAHGYARHPASANGTRQAVSDPEHFSHGLPNLEVTPVVVEPIAEPDQLPGSPVGVIRVNYRDLPSGDELLDLADRSPAGRQDRHYIRATTSSFDGQLVVSVYVSAVLQGHSLRVIMRPYVLQPLVVDLITIYDLISWNPLVLAYYAVMVTMRGWKSLAVRIGRGGGGAARATFARPGLRSTRETYARPFVNNIHQAEDASRAIQLLEEKIITATMDFLRKRNVDIENHQQQVEHLMYAYSIMGDAVITPGTPSGSQVANVTGQGAPGLAGASRAWPSRPAAQK